MLLNSSKIKRLLTSKSPRFRVGGNIQWEFSKARGLPGSVQESFIVQLLEENGRSVIIRDSVPEESISTIPKEILEERLHKKKSQQQIALEFGTSQATVSRLVQGYGLNR